MTYIYALIDPTTNEIRYIGKSDAPERRFKEHVDRQACPDSYKANWIKKLRSKNLMPGLKILAICEEGIWPSIECGAIAYARKLGMRLTNMAEGGLGNKGTTKTPAQKDKIRRVAIGRTHTDATKEKIRQAFKGRKVYGRKTKMASSPYYGVSWHARDRKWRAQIGSRLLGMYKNEIAAAQSYDNIVISENLANPVNFTCEK